MLKIRNSESEGTHEKRAHNLLNFNVNFPNLVRMCENKLQNLAQKGLA